MKLYQNIEWNKGAKSNQVYVYSCAFSKSNNETILAGSSGVNEVRMFENKEGYKCVGGAD